jgi:hypothetical protein
MADVQSAKRKSALRAELSEARRSIKLSDQIAQLQSRESEGHEWEKADKVTQLISSLTGGNGETISLFVKLLLAVLIELSGALLWFEIFAVPHPQVQEVHVKGTRVHAEVQAGAAPSNATPSMANDVPLDVPQVVKTGNVVGIFSKPKTGDEVHPQVQELLGKIADGVCRPTIRDIKRVMRCSQLRASELQKMVSA